MARGLLGRLEGLSLRFRKIMLMIEHPQIQIALRFAGKILQNLAAANLLDDRHIHRVEPVRDGPLFGNVTLQVETPEVAMHGDMFQRAVDAIRDGQTDLGPWTQLVEAGAFEETDFLAEDLQGLRLEIGRDVDAR